jgi:predicted aminopeptidase
MNRLLPFVPLAVAFLMLSQTGCYYSHLASGQIKLLWLRQPIEEATEDSAHPEETRALLRLVESVRTFAAEIGLNVEGQYTSYVDWPGDRIVTTLVRTRPGSLEVVPNWFPIVGELPYKGYFDQDRAEAEAKRLREDEGFDVCVSPVTAYSTLGWVDDPVTSPMLARGAGSLVETLLHELVHATAFLPDSADFNESVAQFIGQQAAILFFERISLEHLEPGLALPEFSVIRATIEDRRAIAEIITAFRLELIEIGDDADRIERRRLAEIQTRARLAGLPLSMLDPVRVASGSRLSDACLALRGTYVQDLPRHAAVLVALNGDLEAMIARLSRWSEADRSVESFYQVGDAEVSMH